MRTLLQGGHPGRVMYNHNIYTTLQARSGIPFKYAEKNVMKGDELLFAHRAEGSPQSERSYTHTSEGSNPSPAPFVVYHFCP